MTARGWRRTLLLETCALLALISWLAMRPAEAQTITWKPPTFAMVTPPPPPPVCSRPATKAFTPTTATIPGITKKAKVLALPRDGRDVPSAPPVMDKLVFAWDAPGTAPGSDSGNVIMNTHTWPDGSAMGNALLAKWQVGDRIILRGKGGVELCYEIDERVELPVSWDGWDGFYDRGGEPELALVVCSGTRLGPGNWSHRTVWFGHPVTS